MNTPDNKQSQETPADKIHKEEYENRAVFNIREERLKELGYTVVITVESPHGETPEEQTEDAINILLEENREIMLIICGHTVKLYQRAPGSNLPTAKEDYDSPAGEDAVIAHAVTCVRTGMKKDLN